MASKRVLEGVIRQMLVPLKNIPLYLVIESLCGCEVKMYDGVAKRKLIAAARLAASSINSDGIMSRRPNEAGNYIEPHVVEALQSSGFTAGKPVSGKGVRRRVGYPDIAATFGKNSFYIECKTYSSKTVDSSMRSFYLSPTRDSKVTKDAYHIILAFSLVQAATGVFRADGFKLVDARELLCDVKYEFQSSNARLYSKTGGARLIYEEAF